MADHAFPCRIAPRNVLFLQNTFRGRRNAGSADTAAARCRQDGLTVSAGALRTGTERQTLRSLRDHAAAASRASERSALLTSGSVLASASAAAACAASHASYERWATTAEVALP